MSDGTVKRQVLSWSQAILNYILADIVSFLIANYHLSEKNADFRKGSLYIVEELTNQTKSFSLYMKRKFR